MSTDSGLPHEMPRSATGTDPQHLLMTLLGDYWRGNAEPIPSPALVDLLGEFGTTESSARQAIRRLTQRGLLVSSKQGRSTFYARSNSTSVATAERLRRAMGFGVSYPEWDGLWTVVVFSVPESQRDVRRLLRNGLRDRGFALLQEAVWVTPHDRGAEAVELLDRLQVTTGSVMRSELIERPRSPAGLGEPFEIDTLESEYRQFVADYEDEVAPAAEGRLSPADALLLRTRLTGRWLGFRFLDPELPRALLPESWPRDRAREVFVRIYDSLGAPAEARFGQILARHDPRLAQLTSHHVSSDGHR